MDNNIKIIADYHTHTVYSHGKGTVRDNVVEAIKKGLTKIAITDHGTGHFIFGISDKSLIAQNKEIFELRKEFPNIEILQGVESNIKGMSGKLDVSSEIIPKLDVLLCGFHQPVFADKFSDYFKIFYNSYSHYLYKPTPKQIVKNTDAYINAIVSNKIDIITHLNFHLRVDCAEVSKCCSEYGTVVELSSRHSDMNDLDYRAIAESDVYIALNSDAHKISNIANCNNALEASIKYGISHKRIINCDETDFTVFRSQKHN